MSKRHYKQQTSEPAIAVSPSTLPTQEPVAVYYRQSTDAQVGNVSTTIQTVDMVAYLKQRGWSDEQVIMMDMDAGISGTTKIDERPGMKALFQLITEGKIRAVACQDEDRLFRDVTQIQVNIFIEACKQAHVMVLTPSMVYDFAHEQMGTFHARQFRFKCEMAAEYIDSYVKGRLHKARRRVMLEGKWVGGRMPPGLMVDIRKILPDGNPNPNYRKYEPFDAYAEVAREYFKLFLEHTGNVRATQMHIHKHGPYWPDPSTTQPPPGFRISYELRNYGYGFCPSRTALIGMFTNAAYIGHWAVNQTVIRWNNHPAIIEKNIFMHAFNYLSPVTLDGRPNPNYRPAQQHARPSLDAKRPVPRPLCSGMIIGEHNGRMRNVSTHWHSGLKCYRYALKTGDFGDEFAWSKSADAVDRAVSTLLRERLQETFNTKIWEETLAATAKKYQQEYRMKVAQREAVEKVMQNQIASLDMLSSQELIRAVQQRYEDAKLERERLTAEIALTDDEVLRLETINKLKNKYGDAFEKWDEMPRNQQRVVLHSFIHHVEGTLLERNKVLQLRILWKDRTESTVILLREASIGRQWSYDETQELLSLLDSNASQAEIAAAFPTRTWNQIRCKIYELRGKGANRFTKRPILDHESYETYQSRLRDGIEASTGDSAARWTVAEKEALLALIDAQAPSNRFIETFPNRTWRCIKVKIRKLRDMDVPVLKEREILETEKFALYKARKAREERGPDPAIDVSSFVSGSETAPGSRALLAYESETTVFHRNPCAADRRSEAATQCATRAIITFQRLCCVP